MVELIPDTFPPSPRVPDRCASCGEPIEVLTRTWEWMSSFWGKVYGANLCSKTRCRVKIEATPLAIVREVERRQAELDNLASS